MLLRDLRVLIVDDNPSDRLVVRSIFSSLRVSLAHEAEDGSIAEGKLINAADMNQPYDVVMVDWNMPRTNGLKLLQFIRVQSRLKNTKVIIMTATSELDVVEDAIANGASDFIVKPVKLKLLEEKLGRVLAST